MKIAILHQNGFRIEERQIPECGVNEVLVKVSHCGVCSGDLFHYQNKNSLVGDSLALGHEVSGTVMDVGDKVRTIAPGDLVTSVDGVAGYAEYFLAPVEFIAKIPEGAQPASALGEPIACCVHAINRLCFKPGMTAAVLGCGFMGLICIQLLKIRGVKSIVAIDPVAYRRNMALEQGADEACTEQDLAQYDRDIGLFDIVVEAAGVQAALDSATALVRQHGQILIVGYHQSQGGHRQVDMQLWNYKAIDVFNGHIRSMTEKYDAMLEGLKYCQQGLVNLSPFIATYPLADIEHAFQDLTDPDKEVFKAVIENVQ